MYLVEKNKGISGFYLDSDKKNIDLSKAKEKGIFLEFKNNKLITISFRDAQKFVFASPKREIYDVEKFISTHNHVFDGRDYIFDENNINIYRDGNSYEFLMFSNSVKDSYVKHSEHKTSNEKVVLEFINYNTYKSINDISFGINPNNIISNIGKPSSHSELGYPKVIFYYENFIIRFDDNRFTQLLISNPEKVLIKSNNNDIDISTDDGFNFLKSNYEFIRNRSYYVFSDLGLSISNEKDESKEFYFFDRDLLKFWENTKRPITSW